MQSLVQEITVESAKPESWIAIRQCGVHRTSYIVQYPQATYRILIHETTNGVLKPRLRNSHRVGTWYTSASQLTSQSMVLAQATLRQTYSGDGYGVTKTKTRGTIFPTCLLNSCLKLPTGRGGLHRVNRVPSAQTPICGTANGITHVHIPSCLLPPSLLLGYFVAMACTL